MYEMEGLSNLNIFYNVHRRTISRRHIYCGKKHFQFAPHVQFSPRFHFHYHYCHYFLRLDLSTKSIHNNWKLIHCVFRMKTTLMANWPYLWLL